MMTYERIEIARAELVGGYIALVEVHNGRGCDWLIHYRAGTHTERWRFPTEASARKDFAGRVRLAGAD